MEVFNATQDLNPQQNYSGGSFSKKQWIGLLSVGVLVLSIFITTGMAQQAQKFFSKAFSGPGSYGYGSFGSGQYLGVSTVASPTPSQSSSASPTAQPSVSNKPGDTDGDLDVDIFDYNLVITEFGKTNDPNTKADLDNDNDVDIFDYNLVVTNFGK